jgi:hypothetical protein
MTVNVNIEGGGGTCRTTILVTVKFYFLSRKCNQENEGMQYIRKPNEVNVHANDQII